MIPQSFHRVRSAIPGSQALSTFALFREDAEQLPTLSAVRVAADGSSKVSAFRQAYFTLPHKDEQLKSGFA